MNNFDDKKSNWKKVNSSTWLRERYSKFSLCEERRQLNLVQPINYYFSEIEMWFIGFSHSNQSTSHVPRFIEGLAFHQCDDVDSKFSLSIFDSYTCSNSSSVEDTSPKDEPKKSNQIKNEQSKQFPRAFYTFLITSENIHISCDGCLATCLVIHHSQSFPLRFFSSQKTSSILQKFEFQENLIIHNRICLVKSELMSKAFSCEKGTFVYDTSNIQAEGNWHSNLLDQRRTNRFTIEVASTGIRIVRVCVEFVIRVVRSMNSFLWLLQQQSSRVCILADHSNWTTK